jgi:hypothetical protein
MVALFLTSLQFDPLEKTGNPSFSTSAVSLVTPPMIAALAPERIARFAFSSPKYANSLISFSTIIMSFGMIVL